MDEATRHQLALRGEATLARALEAERAEAEAAAESHRQAQRSFSRRFRETLRRALPKAPLTVISPSPRYGDTPPKFLGAGVQYGGTAPLVTDVASAHFEQHIDVKPTEVIIVPFEIAQLLLALPSTPWVANLVFPDNVVVSHDGPSGLDSLFIGSTECWGAMTGSGQPYFDPDNGAAPGEARRCLYTGGKVYLSND